jgi:hypothetical protein
MIRSGSLVYSSDEFTDRALKLILMNLADAGISPLLTDLKQQIYGFDKRVRALWSPDPTVEAVLDRCIVDAAATMVNDCADEPFPILPRRIVKPWMDNAKRQPLDSSVVDVWITDLAVEARARRAEKIANGDLP